MVSWSARHTRLAVVVAAVLTLAVAMGVVPAAAAPVATAPHGSTTGAAWEVTRSASGGFTVRLTLPSAVPVRAAQPQLAVDGRVLGYATQDRDGRTLRVRTADAWVASATRVELAWNGVVAGAAPGAGPTVTPDAAGPAASGPLLPGPLLPEDPAVAAAYPVGRADYDLGDTAVRLPGLGGQAVEMRAAVDVPTGAVGRRPVVIFLHGRHQPCYGGPDRPSPVSPPSWPCSAGQLPVPSNLGYQGAATALAAAGYIVVSISADGINALDFLAPDGGAQARGELVLAHLDQLKVWNAGRGSEPEASALKGRLDLDHVGLMGHSRGGEGVVKAALLNAERPAPYGIRAVMPLAPVDFGRATLPGVAMAVVLPYCDGDVSDQQGQHFFDDTRHASADSVLRTSLLVMGANHNFFNSEWTPGTSTAPSSDDWQSPSDPVCGRRAPDRLTAAEQRAVGTVYISGFFRLNLGAERQFLPLFDGTGGRAASAGRAVVYTEAQQPAAARTDLAALEAPSSTVTTTPGAVYCASLSRTGPAQLPPCVIGTSNPTFFPHWTPANLAPQVPSSPMVRMTWGPAAPAQAVTVAVPASKGVRQALTFRTAPGSRAPSDLLVTATDRSGRSATTTVAKSSAALTPLPVLPDLDRVSSPKVWLRTVRLPLALFAGVDLRELATVTFASSGKAGTVYLSDVALDTPTAASGGPSTLPSVSVGASQVVVEDSAVRAQLAVTLSRPSTVPVTVQIQIGAIDNDGRVQPRWIPVTIPAGGTSVPVRFTVNGGGSGHGESLYENSLSVPINAIVGDALGALSVLTF